MLFVQNLHVAHKRNDVECKPKHGKIQYPSSSRKVFLKVLRDPLPVLDTLHTNYGSKLFSYLQGSRLL